MDFASSPDNSFLVLFELSPDWVLEVVRLCYVVEVLDFTEVRHSRELTSEEAYVRRYLPTTQCYCICLCDSLASSDQASSILLLICRHYLQAAGHS